MDTFYEPISPAVPQEQQQIVPECDQQMMSAVANYHDQSFFPQLPHITLENLFLDMPTQPTLETPTEHFISQQPIFFITIPQVGTAASDASTCQQSVPSGVDSEQPKKKKRTRTAFKKHQLERMEREFQACPYMARDRRIEVGKVLALDEQNIKVWFQNRRSRAKREAHSEQSLQQMPKFVGQEKQQQQHELMEQQQRQPQLPATHVEYTLLQKALQQQQPQQQQQTQLPVHFAEPQNTSQFIWQEQQQQTQLPALFPEPTMFTMQQQQPVLAPPTPSPTSTTKSSNVADNIFELDDIFAYFNNTGDRNCPTETTKANELVSMPPTPSTTTTSNSSVITDDDMIVETVCGLMEDAKRGDFEGHFKMATVEDIELNLKLSVRDWVMAHNS